MNILHGLGPQEITNYYDHPYFGQLFLAGVFWIIGYPDSLHPSFTQSSIESLYLVPRVLMGLLAVLDTFLIYKISEKRYDRRVALIASILFAVMPMTWLLRRIFLDNIQLPFVLFAILLPMYTSASSSNKKNLLLVLLSGIFLGLSVFTKIPTFTLIPLVGYVLFSNKCNRSIKAIGLWLIPVLLIPMIWPIYSISLNNYDNWENDVLKQANRNPVSMLDTFVLLAKIDPILIIIAIPSLILLIWRRDIFILLWLLPSLIFHLFIEYYPYREFILIFPLFSIAAGVSLVQIPRQIQYKSIARILPIGLVLLVATFGLFYTQVLITTNVTFTQFETIGFVSNILDRSDTTNATVISSPIYSWIFTYIYDKPNVVRSYKDIHTQSLNTDKMLLIVDHHFRTSMKTNPILSSFNKTTSTIGLFNNTNKFDNRVYPYGSMNLNQNGLRIIEVKASWLY